MALFGFIRSKTPVQNKSINASVSAVTAALRDIASRDASKKRLAWLDNQKQQANARPAPPTQRSRFVVRTSLPYRVAPEAKTLLQALKQQDANAKLVAPVVLDGQQKIYMLPKGDANAKTEFGTVIVEHNPADSNTTAAPPLEIRQDPKSHRFQIVLRYLQAASQLQSPGAKNTGGLSQRLRGGKP